MRIQTCCSGLGGMQREAFGLNWDTFSYATAIVTVNRLFAAKYLIQAQLTFFD
jgi:hypothetical protein